MSPVFKLGLKDMTSLQNLLIKRLPVLLFPYKMM
ncbi:hypothetical protein Q604_UNBC18656G0002, partial [human gut metagenome]